MLHCTIYFTGIASNIPGHTQSKLFWSSNLGEKFCESFLDYLTEISEKQAKILFKQFKHVFNYLEMRLEYAEENKNQYGIKLYQKLLHKLENTICRLPVIGYNSAKFDCRLLKRVLAPALYQKFGKTVSVQMKDGRYTKITTPNLLFLDQMNYLSAKCSYDQFIYNTLHERMKSKLCYEWLDDLQKLEYDSLPDYEHWFSTLKNCNVLDVEWQAFQEYVKQGLSEEQAIKNLGLHERPKPGREVLQDLRQMFEDKKFGTFKNFVAYYLEYDVSML